MLRKITIKSVLNGFIVKVGCQTLVFDDVNVMLSELGKYLLDPDEVEREYLDNSINSGRLWGAVEIPEPPALSGLPGILRTCGSPTTWASSEEVEVNDD